MRIRELNESMISAKRRFIKSEGQLVYDGDLREYEFRGSFMKRLVDETGAALGEVGRQLDHLLIVKNGSKRWLLATSSGKPEIAFYYYYDAGGFRTFIYIDYLRYKTQDWLALPTAERAQTLSSNPTDPSEMWRRERSIDMIGSALETMPKPAADEAIKKVGPKLLKAIGSMDVSAAPNLMKLARLLNSLMAIGTEDSIKFAKAAEAAHKRGAIRQILVWIKHNPDYKGIYSAMKAVKLLKAHFDWPELENLDKILKAV